MKLFAIEEEQENEEGIDTACFYVVAENMREALSKWKSFIASLVNDDLRGRGDAEALVIPSDIHDPVSVSLVAMDWELVL